MARSFTPNQQAAIDVRDGSVLVSAAAGSGKTAVLTRRVVDILTDAQNPVSPDKILVVTFTNAAAAEMRQRIFSGISERILQDPDNRYLKTQQSMLSFAEICTIDSFCMRLVKEHAAMLGLRRDLNVGEAAQMSVLAKKALGTVLGSYYEAEDPVFLQLCEMFGSGKNDAAFEDSILRLYRFFMSIPSKELWIESRMSQFDHSGEFFDNLW